MRLNRAKASANQVLRCRVELLEQRRLLAAIISGERVLGSIAAAGATESYTFDANAGDSVVLSLGELANWSPRLELFGPDNSSLGSASGGTGTNDFNRQIESLSLAQSGTYTAVVSGVGTSTGNFALTLAKLPGTQTFDQGPIVSGQRFTGTLQRGETDIYTFSANVGETVILSIGELENWAPRLDVFAPDGTRPGTISGGAGTNDFNRQITLTGLTQSGTWYAVVRAASSDSVGNYGLSMVRMPALQPFDDGPLLSGERKRVILERGDLDILTFSANAGNSVIVSIGELTNWSPQVDVYGPSGQLLGSASGGTGTNDFNRQVELLNLTQAGTYFIVARSSQADGAGECAISLARLPSAQPFDSGPILSGQRKFGMIDRGDVDVYTFSATPGEAVVLSLGEFVNWAPRLDVFAPDGSRPATVSGGTGTNDYNRQVELLNLTQGGTYYAVVRSSQSDATGEYALSFARLPGAQSPDITDNDGGAIASGQTTSAAIAAGDLDVYTLPLTIGSSAMVQMARLTGTFTSQLDLFAPSGVRLFSQTGAPTATINLASAPDTGTYYIVARTSSVAAVGNYSIAVDTTPGPDTRPPGVVSSEFLWNAPRQQIVFLMNESIAGSIQVSDMTLTNLTTAQTIPNGNMSVTFNTQSNRIMYEFPSYPFAALPDGDYRATLNAGSVSDAAGNMLPADHSFEFFFLNGDANRDRTVNLADFNRLAGNFGRIFATFSQGDHNYDDTVGLADFNVLAGQFGKVLPPVIPDGRFASPRSAGLFGEHRVGADNRDDETAAILA